MSKPIIIRSKGGYARFALYSGAMVETSRGGNTIARHELKRAIQVAQNLVMPSGLSLRRAHVSYVNDVGVLVDGSHITLWSTGRMSIGCKKFLKRETKIIIKWALGAK